MAKAVGYSVRMVYRWEQGLSVPKKPVIDLMRRMADAENEADRPSTRPPFTFVDLFAGIGGMRMGFESAGGRCVFTSEWDRHCQKTYLANFKTEHPVAGDITEIPASAVPPHDVLLAGFPCQPFSVAGVSKKNSLGVEHGFKCMTQGTLFFDIVRILEHHRPKAFLLENVKNLKSHDRGRTFEVITEALTKGLGYRIQYRIIDARRVLPQHRERIFIVGFLEDTDFDINNLPLPKEDEGPTLGSILHPEDGSEQAMPPYTLGEKGEVNEKYTLSEHLWNYLQQYAEQHRKKGNGFGFGLFGPEHVARTLSARYHKDGSEILIRQDGGRRPRRLTPRECSRIMGFDGPGESSFHIPVSDTQAYRQFGNAVAVPVVTALANEMARYLQSHEHGSVLAAGG
jgi:DNA (cytosine-5)-methyltransferase 1